MAYVPNKNFIALIDKRLNQMEFYFRSKWYKYNDRMTAIQKYLRRGSNDAIDAHLALYDYNSGFKTPILTFKYTTCVYQTKANLEMEKEKPIVCLKIPRGKGQYEKTWGSVDYIIGEIQNDHGSVVYYFNREKLFTYLKARESTSQQMRDYLSEKGVNIEDYYSSEDTGIDVVWLDRLGIIDHEDWIDWKLGAFSEIRTSNTGKEPAYFTYRWPHAGESARTAYWPNVTLHSAGDRSVETILVNLTTGKEFRFRSVAEASQQLFGESARSKEAGIRDVIKGRAKTFRVNGVAFSARFA